MVGKGGTKESLEWRFYGPATSLFDVETSRTGTKVVVRTAKNISVRWRIRDKAYISSPREEAHVSYKFA